MAPGTYWIYQGEVRWTHDTDQFGAAKITWRTEVRRFFEYGNIRAALISGWPSDLNWSDGKSQPSESLLVESGNKFYLIAKERSEDVLRRLDRPDASLSDLLLDDDLLFGWPLTTHQKFCDAESRARSDDMYCWLVESVLRSSTSRGQTEYTLVYRTNPDHALFTFVPNIGIVAYEYHHHGTVADTTLKLTEFHIATPLTKSNPPS